MKEFKIRLWNNKTKMMSIDCDITKEDHLVRLLNTVEQYGVQEMIFMKHTGIECNGFEWYEGDILECDSDWYQITWDEDQLRFEATGIKSTGESLALCELISSETWVQGNIYQNSELLR